MFRWCIGWLEQLARGETVVVNLRAETDPKTAFVAFDQPRVLRVLKLATVDHIRAYRQPLVSFSPGLETKRPELKAFLMENLHHHYRAMRMAVKAQKVMTDLFRA